MNCWNNWIPNSGRATQNPRVILQTIPQEKIKSSLATPELRQRLNDLLRQNHDSWNADAWFRKNHRSRGRLTVWPGIPPPGLPFRRPAAGTVSNSTILANSLGESTAANEDGMIKTNNSMDSKIAQLYGTSVPWLETAAEVTACHYEFARMNTLSLGIATGRNQFVVSFSYYAHARTFSDECTSPVAMRQGETFPVFYNPLNPQQNSRSESASTTKAPLLAVGIAGSIVISLLYVAMMSGC
jgi:hypothetical protein